MAYYAPIRHFSLPSKIYSASNSLDLIYLLAKAPPPTLQRTQTIANAILFSP